MTNLEQIINLHEKYGLSNNLLQEKDIKTLKDIIFEKNTFDNVTEEGYVIQRVKKAFDQSKIAKEILHYFTQREKIKVTLLFIDIDSFSTKFEELDTETLGKFLDLYYETVIPIIHKYGGEVEKIIGDGIIAVFGKPFLDNSEEDLFTKALDSSVEILSNTIGKILQSKIALHCGEVMYYQNENINYNEFTMIGKSMTELHRLESVCEPNSISYFVGTEFDTFINKQSIMPINRNDFEKKAKENGNELWAIGDPKDINLKGISYSKIRYIYKD
jgi:hypothetical protein